MGALLSVERPGYRTGVAWRRSSHKSLILLGLRLESSPADVLGVLRNSSRSPPKQLSDSCGSQLKPSRGGTCPPPRDRSFRLDGDRGSRRCHTPPFARKRAQFRPDDTARPFFSCFPVSARNLDRRRAPISTRSSEQGDDFNGKLHPSGTSLPSKNRARLGRVRRYRVRRPRTHDSTGFGSGSAERMAGQTLHCGRGWKYFTAAGLSSTAVKRRSGHLQRPARPTRLCGRAPYDVPAPYDPTYVNELMTPLPKGMSGVFVISENQEGLIEQNTPCVAPTRRRRPTRSTAPSGICAARPYPDPTSPNYQRRWTRRGQTLPSPACSFA